MNPLEFFIFHSGLRAGLDWLRSGGQAGIYLINELRGLFPGWTMAQYGDAARYARENYDAANAVEGLGPGQQLNPNLVPHMPGLNVDPSIGERYRAVLDVQFQPTEDGPTLVRRMYWTGAAPPTGRDIQTAVAEYVARQIGLWGKTPGSAGPGADEGLLSPDEAYQGFDVYQINVL